MKKFFKLFICACLCVVSLTFTACGKKSKIEAPSGDAPVYSNGGIVVQKGDFIYYANGYKSVDTVKKSDLNRKYGLGGLYVTKTDSSRDKYGSLNYNNRLSSKLSSFEATDLNIFGNYMYYTTINTEETKKGGLQTKHLEIYRVKLNSTGSERVYRSGINFKDTEGKRVVDFNYSENNGTVYITIFENGKLKRISCGSSISGASTVATNVLSYKTEGSKTYFVKVNDDDKYELNIYNAVSNKIETKLAMDKNDTISSIFDVKFNNVYFYATFNDVGSEYLYRMPIENIVNKDSIRTTAVKLTATSYTSVYLLDNYTDGILVLSSSKVEIIDEVNPLDNIELQSNMPTDATIMKIDGGFVYYYKGKDIKRWNYIDDTVETIYTEENTICAYAFDIVGDYLYYYTTVKSNDYLFRVSISGVLEDKKAELMGEYESQDAPEIEEDEEE